MSVQSSPRGVIVARGTAVSNNIRVADGDENYSDEEFEAFDPDGEDRCSEYQQRPPSWITNSSMRQMSLTTRKIKGYHQPITERRSSWMEQSQPNEQTPKFHSGGGGDTVTIEPHQPTSKSIDKRTSDSVQSWIPIAGISGGGRITTTRRTISSMSLQFEIQPTKSCSTLSLIRKRLASQPRKKTSIIQQRLNSAMEIQIKDLTSKIRLLETTINDLTAENRALKSGSQRQAAALRKYEGTESDFPRVLTFHQNEVKYLHQTLRKAQANCRKHEDMTRDLSHQVRSLEDQNRKLQKFVQCEELDERHKLQRRVYDLTQELQSANEKFEECCRKFSLIKKNHIHQLESVEAKYKSSSQRVYDAEQELYRLTEVIRQKDRVISYLRMRSREPGLEPPLHRKVMEEFKSSYKYCYRLEESFDARALHERYYSTYGSGSGSTMTYLDNSSAYVTYPDEFQQNLQASSTSSQIEEAQHPGSPIESIKSSFTEGRTSERPKRASSITTVDFDIDYIQGFHGEEESEGEKEEIEEEHSEGNPENQNVEEIDDGRCNTFVISQHNDPFISRNKCESSEASLASYTRDLLQLNGGDLTFPHPQFLDIEDKGNVLEGSSEGTSGFATPDGSGIQSLDFTEFVDDASDGELIKYSEEEFYCETEPEVEETYCPEDIFPASVRSTSKSSIGPQIAQNFYTFYSKPSQLHADVRIRPVTFVSHGNSSDNPSKHDSILEQYRTDADFTISDKESSPILSDNSHDRPIARRRTLQTQIEISELESINTSNSIKGIIINDPEVQSDNPCELDKSHQVKTDPLVLTPSPSLQKRMEQGKSIPKPKPKLRTDSQVRKSFTKQNKPSNPRKHFY